MLSCAFTRLLSAWSFRIQGLGGLRVLRSKSKRWFKKALVRSNLLRAASRLSSPTAVILSYHSIVEDTQTTDHILGISRDRASFEAHMETLAKNFSPVTVEDVAQFATSGRQLPPHAVAVTFDDGFADNYEVALPILKRYGIPATFYIMVDAVENGMLPWYCRLRFAFNTTKKPEWSDSDSNRTYGLVSPEQRKAALTAAWEIGARLTGAVQQEFIGRVEKALEIEPGFVNARAPHGFMLDWEQVRGLKKAGHTIGAHTLSHPNVAQVSASEARSEIAGSKKETRAGNRRTHRTFFLSTPGAQSAVVETDAGDHAGSGIQVCSVDYLRAGAQGRRAARAQTDLHSGGLESIYLEFAMYFSGAGGLAER